MSQNPPPRPIPPPQSGGGRYDYSHLRESQDEGHWYAYPPVDPQAPTMPHQAAPPPPMAPPPPEAAYPSVPSPIPPYGPNPRAIRQRVQQRKRRRAMGLPEEWAWVIILGALLGVTLICSLFLVLVIRANRGGEGETLVAAPQIAPTSIIYEDGGALGEESLTIQRSKWTGQERFTILLMGLDKRPGEEGTVFRTDSMMLISLDPATNSIGILSLPRDLYVEVPYYGLHRVNAAYVLGELEQSGRGPTLAKQTVQYNLGIPVNEYVTVDFQAVIGMVDAIGGVEIEVPKAIIDYQYPTMDYGTEVFSVEAGWQTMDGATALKYARTRHASDDIDRAKRQQQVIYAFRDKVTSLDMVDDLLVQAPFIYAQLQDGISTGLSFDQIIELALWAAEVPRENIHSGVLSWEYLIGYQTPGGASVLVPNRASIGPLMIQVFGENYSQP